MKQLTNKILVREAVADEKVVRVHVWNL